MVTVVTAASLLLNLAAACAAAGGKMFQQRGGDDVLYTKELGTEDASSAGQCAFLCASLPGCFGFDFSESDKQCVLHDAGAMLVSTPQLVNRGNEVWQNFGIPDLFCEPDVGSCLYYVLTPMSWAAARAHCQSLGMDLAAIETQQELAFANRVRNYVSDSAGALATSVFWLGASDLTVEGRWVWEKTGESTRNTETIWGPGEPNGGTGESCMEWCPGEARYNDVRCSTVMSMICET